MTIRTAPRHRGQSDRVATPYLGGHDEHGVPLTYYAQRVHRMILAMLASGMRECTRCGRLIRMHPAKRFCLACKRERQRHDARSRRR